MELSENHDNTTQLDKCFRELSSAARELYLGDDVPMITNPPTPLEFLRDWVNLNKPVIIKGVTRHWPALERWKDSNYLRSKIGSKSVSVQVTPNGYADAINENKFVMPEERTMPFNDVLDVIEKKVEKKGIFYVQTQNSNFTSEFNDLMQDAAQDIPWASEALGKCPDAVNFWIGEEKAVTSMHKDHYENLYCVIRGTKTFTLHPPTDQPYIPYGFYQSAKYHENGSGDFEIIDEEGSVPWISVDPLNPDYKTYPEYQLARSYTVTVQAGDTLYLPSLWYHHVQQSQGCIAVNYWYDMEYDIKYNYYTFVEKLLKTSKTRDT